MISIRTISETVISVSSDDIDVSFPVSGWTDGRMIELAIMTEITRKDPAFEAAIA